MFFGAWGRDAPSAKGDPSCEGGIGTAGDVGRRPEGHMAMILIGCVGFCKFCWLRCVGQLLQKPIMNMFLLLAKKVAIAPSGHGMPREDPHWLSLRTLAESQNEDPDGHGVMVMTTWRHGWIFFQRKFKQRMFPFMCFKPFTVSDSVWIPRTRTRRETVLYEKVTAQYAFEECCNLVIWESWFLIIAVIAVIAVIAC